MTRPCHLAAPIALAFLAALAGCAYQPSRFVRYEAAGPADVWNHGLRLHPARTDSLAVLTGFVDYGARATPEGPLFGSPLTFLILAQNTSRQPVTLDPMRFRLHVPDSGISLAPLDPESEIHAAARDMADEHGRYVHDQSTDAIVDGIGGALDLLSIFAPRTPEEEEEAQQIRSENRERRAEEAREHSDAMRKATARRDQWSGRSLRKTTLLPGMRAQGTVSFVQRAELPFPDTLILRYASGDVRLESLGRYAKIVDSLPAPERRDSLARTPAAGPKAASIRP